MRMRLQSIVLTNLIHERLVQYELLEREMNSNSDINKSCKKIKKLLKKIAILNAMIAEWQNIINDGGDMLPQELNKEENG